MALAAGSAEDCFCSASSFWACCGVCEILWGISRKGLLSVCGLWASTPKGGAFFFEYAEWQADSCSALTLWRNLTTSNAMEKMLYSFLFWLIMSGLGAFLAMASSQRVGYCGRLKQEIETFIESMFRSADLKEKFWVDWSNGGKWNLPCFIYSDYQRRLLRHFLCSARGVFLSFYLTFSLWTSNFAVKFSLYV